MRVSRRCDETICFGGVCIAKNAGVVNRIDAIHAARQHKSTSVLAGIIGQCSGSSTEDEGCRESNL